MNRIALLAICFFSRSAVAATTEEALNMIQARLDRAQEEYAGSISGVSESWETIHLPDLDPVKQKEMERLFLDMLDLSVALIARMSHLCESVINRDYADHLTLPPSCNTLDQDRKWLAYMRQQMDGNP
jgi:hypothetical protein